MGDVLKIGQWGAEGSLILGLSTASDNHGNTFGGRSLTCAGKPVRLNIFDSALVMEDIDSVKGLSIIRFDGEFPVPDGQQSPLQRMCNDIAARGHHTFADWAAREFLDRR